MSEDKQTLVSIDSLTLHHQDAEETEPTRTLYRTDMENWQRDSGSDTGSITVRIGVDGEFDLVSARLGRTSDLDALDRALTALSNVRDRLVELYGTGQQHAGGRCLAESDWGRCLWGSGHQDPEHHYETAASLTLSPTPRADREAS